LPINGAPPRPAAKSAWDTASTAAATKTALNVNTGKAVPSTASQRAATSQLLAAPKPSLGGWVHAESNSYEAKHKKQSAGQPHLLLSDTFETTLAPRRSRNCIAASNQATGDSSVQKRMQSDVKSRVVAQEVAIREAAYNRRSDGFYDAVGCSTYTYYSPRKSDQAQ